MIGTLPGSTFLCQLCSAHSKRQLIRIHILGASKMTNATHQLISASLEALGHKICVQKYMEAREDARRCRNAGTHRSMGRCSYHLVHSSGERPWDEAAYDGPCGVPGRTLRRFLMQSPAITYNGLNMTLPLSQLYHQTLRSSRPRRSNTFRYDRIRRRSK